MTGGLVGAVDSEAAFVSVLAAARRSDTVTYTNGVYVPPFTPSSLIVGVAGNVTGQLLDDTVDRVIPVLAGVQPLRFKSITQVGTTATGLLVGRG
jgi:hypothetical protein